MYYIEYKQIINFNPKRELNPIKKHYTYKNNGGLAQLARAFDWQSKGHQFESGILHFYFIRDSSPN